MKNEVIATSPIGQAPQALVYVPDAVPAVSHTDNSAMTRMMVVPEGLGTSNLQPLGIAGQTAKLWLAVPGAKSAENAPTSVSLSDQGLVQVLEAAVSGLEPRKPYLLALASEPSGVGPVEPLQSFMTNPAGAAIVNAIGPIRQLVRGEDNNPRQSFPAPPIATALPFKSSVTDRLAARDSASGTSSSPECPGTVPVKNELRTELWLETWFRRRKRDRKRSGASRDPPSRA